MKRLVFAMACALAGGLLAQAAGEAGAKMPPVDGAARKRGMVPPPHARRMPRPARFGSRGFQASDFGKTATGQQAHRYRLMGAGGMVMDFSDHGARVVRIYAPDRYGNLADVTTGFNEVAGYEEYDRNFGVTVGRFGNRIAAGKFTLDGATYQLPLNNGPDDMRCCLHGGTNACNFAIWNVKPMRRPDATGLQFTYVSEDGDQGFPGKMTISVTHWLTRLNVWRIEYEATVEGKACPINLTNHAYFNLKGMGEGTILDHDLTIFGSKMTPVNRGLIPTGELRDVAGTPFDFRTVHKIGERIEADDEQLKFGKGYDHNWVLDGEAGALKKAAVLSEATSGRFVEVWTTEPGLQFYAGNQLSVKKPVPNKDGKILPRRGGLALETQHFPDSPNHANFPSTILKPGETYKSVTEYRFGVTK